MRSAEAPVVQINVPALAPVRVGDHVHTCPECHENERCEYACSTEHDLTLDDGTPRGAYVVCDACKMRKQKTRIACRTWEQSWRDEYMQYSYDRGVFEGAAILDGLVGMGIAIAQRRERATPRRVEATRCPVHTPTVTSGCATCAAIATVAARPRFFVEHGMIHDRVTGKHVTTNTDSVYESGITECCALLNSLAEEAADAIALLARGVELFGEDERAGKPRRVRVRMGRYIGRTGIVESERQGPYPMLVRFEDNDFAWYEPDEIEDASPSSRDPKEGGNAP